tara:strand:+ start:6607 stop:6792 length:186 start_codon:yes stop_codon:yes gene_type:complete
MFTPFKFNQQDLENIKKLQNSEVKSRKVIGRGTLIADASEIRKSKPFQKYLKKIKTILNNQ